MQITEVRALYSTKLCRQRSAPHPSCNIQQQWQCTSSTPSSNEKYRHPKQLHCLELSYEKPNSNSQEMRRSETPVVSLWGLTQPERSAGMPCHHLPPVVWCQDTAQGLDCIFCSLHVGLVPKCTDWMHLSFSLHRGFFAHFLHCFLLLPRRSVLCAQWQLSKGK